MSGEKIQVEGLRAAIRKAKAVHVEVAKEIRVINLQAARAIAAEAVARAPRLLGNLAKSVRAGASRYMGYVKAGGAAVPYAAPIHWGWQKHNIEAQPFMYEALDAKTPEVIGEYAIGIRAAVERAFAEGGTD